MKRNTPPTENTASDPQGDNREARPRPEKVLAQSIDGGDKRESTMPEALRPGSAGPGIQGRIQAALGLLAHEAGISTVLCAKGDTTAGVWLVRYGWHQGAPVAVEGLEIPMTDNPVSGEAVPTIQNPNELGISAESAVFQKFSARPVAVVPFVLAQPDQAAVLLLLDAASTRRTGEWATLAQLVAVIVAGELDKERLFHELAEIEEKFDNLVERANDGIVIVQNRAMVYANQMLLATVGYGAEELLGRPFSEFVAETDRDRMVDIYTRRMRGEDVPPLYEATLVRKDGSLMPVEINAGIIHYQGKPADLAIVRDISQRKAMEAELLKSKKLESVGILAGGIAHDFNNLLTAIMGNISIVLMNPVRDQRDRRLLKEAQAVVMRAKNLTQQLLAFARADSVEKKVMNLSSLLMSTVEFALSGADVKVNFHIAEDLWPVCMDDVQIGQAIHNLVMNSRDLMAPGGELNISARNVSIGRKNKHALPAGRYVQIELRDHGPGISPQHQERVFDPYFSTKETTAERGKGLGLAICHSIVKDHQGAITVESELGIGTAFTIVLPAIPEGTGLTREEEAGADSEYEEKRILLMDDEDMILAVAERMLVRLGYDVVTCRNGLEALRLYDDAQQSDQRFDALILDITVRGGMGGLETLARIKQIHPECRAIASSGYSDVAAIKEHLAAGFAGVLTKPYTLQKLGEVLQDVLGQ